LNKDNKDKLLILSVIAILIIGTIGFYNYPLKIHKIILHIDHIEKIHVDYISEGKTTRYLLNFDSQNTAAELINILDSTLYTRSFTKYYGTTSSVISLYIFYRTKDGVLGNYILSLNEEGDVQRDNKDYHMKGDSKLLFDQVHEWIENQALLYNRSSYNQ
jgi:hypothetical protein